jgi:hypothetical protein
MVYSISFIERGLLCHSETFVAKHEAKRTAAGLKSIYEAAKTDVVGPLMRYERHKYS